jgi:HD-GYP domain-containing protein (c-di-GMP phosphodiesterase class II)
MAFAEIATQAPGVSAPSPGTVQEAPTPAEGGERPEALYYQAAHQEILRILIAVKGKQPLVLGALQRITAGLARAVATGDDLLLQALEAGEPQWDLAKHMVNVAVFAVKIGQGAGSKDEELPWLALAAALHDVGMLAVSTATLQKPGALTEEERGLVRRHPEVGFQILQGLGVEFEWLANVAYQEHERDDGSGYPRGLKGDQIHDYAKIVGLADTYEALTHCRPYRKTVIASDVIKEIILTERRHFPDRILKGLIRGLSTVPVGSLVRLNSNEIARVVATNPAFPLRPVVEIVTGSKGEKLEAPRRVDLASNTLLYITRSHSDKTV